MRAFAAGASRFRQTVRVSGVRGAITDFGKPGEEMESRPWLLLRVLALELHSVAPRALGTKEHNLKVPRFSDGLWLERPLGVTTAAVGPLGRLAQTVEAARAVEAVPAVVAVAKAVLDLRGRSEREGEREGERKGEREEEDSGEGG
eukprot:6191274-Pleurochrysis_carterae.AAC.1